MKLGRRFSRASTRSKSAAPGSLPDGMQIAGAWSWRILAGAGVIALLIFLVIQLRLIVIPVLIAVIVSSLLVPFSFLQRHRWPRWLSIVTAALMAVGGVGGLVVLVVSQVRAGWPDLQQQSIVAWDNFKDFLLQSPLHLTESQIMDFGGQAWEAIQRDSSTLVSGALSIGSTAGHLVAGLLITIFAAIMMLNQSLTQEAYTNDG